MCGRLNIIDDPAVRQLAMNLGINLSDTPIHHRRYVGAADSVQIILEKNDVRQLTTATWWLLLDKTELGFAPSKYTSFNTRSDKLNVPRSAGYVPFRQSRCIIPTKGFGETEATKTAQGKTIKRYFDMEPTEGAIAFGGLYKEYVHNITGEIKVGCSIITLPPNPKLHGIHSKSIPLMLPQSSIMDAWLDNHTQPNESFNELLHPTLRHNLVVTEIDRPSTYRAINDSFIIDKD